MIKKILKFLNIEVQTKNSPDNDSLTTEMYLDLSDNKKNEICQQLNPYDPNEWEIFKAIEKKFNEEYGEHEAIDKVFCGLAPGLGPYNSINVDIKKGKKRIDLPKVYFGFPVVKHYESKKRKKTTANKGEHP